MWTKGTFDGYDFCVKHFDEGSEYGINNGKISKVDIRKDEKILVNYDRGWDIKPKGNAVMRIYKQILEMYN